MKNSQNNEAYFEALLESAIKEYKTTKRYLQLQEGLEEMVDDCGNRFVQEDVDTIFGYFYQLCEMFDQEEKYVYLRVYIDCVKLLKRLKLL